MIFFKEARLRVSRPGRFTHLTGCSWCPPRKCGVQRRHGEPAVRCVKCQRLEHARASCLEKISPRLHVLAVEPLRRHVLATRATAEEGI